MLEKLINMIKGISKKEQKENSSKDMAKERLHLVLMQDRANVSADFLELMKQEIIEVIKKYIEIDEKEIDVRLTTKSNEDGTKGAPALYANIPILNVRNDMKKEYAKNIQNENTDKAEIQTNQISEEKVEVVIEEENDTSDKQNDIDIIRESQEDNNINEINNEGENEGIIQQAENIIEEIQEDIEPKEIQNTENSNYEKNTIQNNQTSSNNKNDKWSEVYKKNKKKHKKRR